MESILTNHVLVQVAGKLFQVDKYKNYLQSLSQFTRLPEATQKEIIEHGKIELLQRHADRTTQRPRGVILGGHETRGP